MAAVTIDPSVSKARRKHPDLLFEWVGSTRHRWRLLMFLNLSLALHVACFYAFQVIYPANVRQRAETTKVTFLDPRDDSVVREVIDRIEDRAVFIDGSLRLPVPGASLEGDDGNEVLPVPGFASHEPSLLLPPALDISPQLPRIFAVGEVFLPPQSRFLPGGKPAQRPQPFEGPYVYRPRLVLTGEIGGLEILDRPDWSDWQKKLAGATGKRIRFLIEVDELGGIASCLPWKGTETIFDAQMARKIETEIQFARPVVAAQGWLEVRW